MNSLKEIGRLYLARMWHALNYPRYKGMQKELADQARAYLSGLPMPEGESPFGLPLNCLAGRGFTRDSRWKAIYGEFAFEGHDRGEATHRKYWEYTQAVYGLEMLGCLHENADVLGVAAGHEPVLYYLANRCRSVTATDLYEGSFATGIAGEADDGVLEDPRRFAPFPYREDRLKFRRMNALSLEFPGESFDGVVCLSSIEHFGSRENYRKGATEIARVLRPGGVAAITTEFAVNGLDYPGYFTAATLQEDIVQASRLEPAGPMDYTLEPDALENICIMPAELMKRPHFVVQTGKVLHTSVSIFLKKPESEDSRQ
jgi:ubiquinone/menaquinone biosynthesis C-methylase UbiE